MVAAFSTPVYRKPPDLAAETPVDLRTLEAAAKETPPRLRNLERRWRQQRRASLGSKPHASSVFEQVPEVAASTLQKSTTSVRVATHRTLVKNDLMPLLAGPLSVGTHTISPNAHLIVSAPPSSAEMTILLPNKKVTVVTGGRQMISVSSDMDSEDAVVFELDLDLAQTWDAEDIEQWTIVAQLLMKLKSRLPLVSELASVESWLTFPVEDVPSQRSLVPHVQSTSRSHSLYSHHRPQLYRLLPADRGSTAYQIFAANRDCSVVAAADKPASLPQGTRHSSHPPAALSHTSQSSLHPS